MIKKFVFFLLGGLFFSASFAMSNELDVLDGKAYKKVFAYLAVEKSDIRLYQNIFDAIEENNFYKVDKYVAKLDGSHLMGHVLAEKYLSQKYSTTGIEIKEWLKLYSDLPQAKRIYALALRKGVDVSDIDTLDSFNNAKRDKYNGLGEDYKHLSNGNLTYVAKNIARFRKFVNQGKTKAAKSILEDSKFRMLVPNNNYDKLSTLLATKYLVDGYDDFAMQWTRKARSRSNYGMAYWIAGLANWRQENYKDAATSFSKLLKTSETDEWLLSASAYWAYRSYNKLGNPKEAKKYLKVASKYPRTFYGILAAYKRGEKINAEWNANSYLNDFNNYEYLNELLSSEAMGRAILLLHAKNYELAEDELRASYKMMTDKQKEAALYIANQYKMHSLAILISNHIKSLDKEWVYDLIAYPVPDWKPRSGWKVDKALVLALARQESSFHPKAKSSAGARGLMQLLPNTAYHITKEKSIKQKSDKLFDAEYNLELGQKYVTYLMEKSFVNYNLFFMMSAYNAGPGNLVKWQKKVEYKDDPLLYIEVIPARETRIYIERVMANYWLYNSRFGQHNPTLKQLSDDKWPVLGD